MPLNSRARARVLCCGALSLLVLLGLGRRLAPVVDATAAAPAGAAARGGAVPLDQATPAAAPVALGAAHRDDAYRDDAYRDDRVMVRAHDLEDLALDHGVRVLRSPGPAGYAALSLPENSSPASFAEQLQQDPRVSFAGRVGLVYGADATEAQMVDRQAMGTSDEAEAGQNGFLGAQWHMSAIQADAGTEVSGVLVAVLDSGVAHEDYTDSSGTYVAAASLENTLVVNPRDFVNGGTHANDDHGHGTHIANLILARGSVAGVAPGAALMPVKVLDENNVGDELTLIDGLRHAVDNNADVINMSLAFAEGYAPSAALLAQIEDAWTRRIVMVAAAGNDGADVVLWPAASPRVIAVGASTLASGGGLVAAPYTNLGPRIDLMAPGGRLDADNDGDGFPDGILAESIVPGDPSRTGLYFYSGSSQAAALVAGAAARAVDDGAEGMEVLAALQLGIGGAGQWTAGKGAGNLDVSGTDVEAADTCGNPSYADPAHISAMVWLAKNGNGSVTPKAEVSVYDDLGRAVRGALVLADVVGSTEAWPSCTTDSSGTCTFSAPSATGSGLYWSIELPAVVRNGVSFKPGPVIYASDAMEILIAAMRDRASLNEGLLAFEYRSANHPVLGPVAPAVLVQNLGTGLAGSPIGPTSVVFTPDLLASAGVTTVSLNLNGTGLAGSPIGPTSVKLVSLSGTGLAGSPIGPTNVKLTTIDVTGLSSGPVSVPFDATTVMSPTGDVSFSTRREDFAGELIQMDYGTSPETSLGGSETDAQLDEGGWVAGPTEPGALLIRSGDLFQP